jgi:hypothetical protein
MDSHPLASLPKPVSRDHAEEVGFSILYHLHWRDTELARCDGKARLRKRGEHLQIDFDDVDDTARSSLTSTCSVN